jgi:hypothetical protein
MNNNGVGTGCVLTCSFGEVVAFFLGEPFGIIVSYKRKGK